MALREELIVDLSRARQQVQQFARTLQDLQIQSPDLDLSQAINEVEQVERALDGIDSKTVSAKLDVDDAETDVAARKLEGLEATKTAKVDVDDSAFDRAMKKIEDFDGEEIEVEINPKDAGGGAFDGAFSKITGKAKLAGAAAGAAFTVAFARIANNANIDAIPQVSIGASEEELERIQQAAAVTRDLIKLSREEAVATLAALTAATRGTDIDILGDLPQLAAGVANIERVFGEDIQSQIRAATQLVRTDLVGSYQEAFDVIAGGFQTGANRSNDFLDSLIEYSPNLRDIGLTADDALTLMNQGLDEGAFNADKILDSFKEFGIRARDETQGVTDAFAVLDIAQGRVVENLNAGGDQARAQTIEILEAVQAIENPIARNQASIELFGTQSEDLGVSVFNAFQLGAESVTDFDGRIAEVNETLDTTRVRLTVAFDEEARLSRERERLETQRFNNIAALRDLSVSGGLQTFGGVDDIDAQLAALDALEARLESLGPVIAAAAEGFTLFDSDAGIEFALEIEEQATQADLDATTERIRSLTEANTEAILLEVTTSPLDVQRLLADIEAARQVIADLSGGFADELSTELDTIADQLQIPINIDTGNAINDVQDFINSAEETLAGFENRQAAADKLDLLGLDELRQQVLSGELDEILDDILIGEGGTTDATLQRANAAIVANQTAQEAAANAAAEAAKIRFTEALESGDNPFSTFLTDLEITPEDFVALAASVQGGVDETFGADALTTDTAADGEGVGAAFLEGIEAGITAGRPELETSVGAVAESMSQIMEKQLGIESPSTVGIEIGRFFDEGLSIGLLSGQTEAAAEQLTGQIAGIESSLRSNLGSAFADEDDTVNDFVEAIRNVQTATADANAEFELLEQRQAALDRLAQFGQFENIAAAISSGQADSLLDDLQFNPSPQLIEQLENELAAAGGLIDPVEVATTLAVDSSPLTQLELQGLIIPTTLDIGDVGGVNIPRFDKGGAVMAPTLAIVAERPEAIVGAHHSGADQYQWIDKVGAMANLAPVVIEKYWAGQLDVKPQHVYAVPAGVGSDPMAMTAVIDELQMLRTELALVSEATGVTAERSVAIADSTETAAGALVRSQSERPMSGVNPGWRP